MNKNLIIKINRIIDANIENLFELWTRPEHLLNWWGPKNVICKSATIDLTIGGKYKLVNQLDTGEIIEIFGEYLAIEPPTLLRFSWNVANISEDEIVTVKLKDKSGKTEVIILHEGIMSDEIKQSHETGWSGCFDGLAKYVNKSRALR